MTDRTVKVSLIAEVNSYLAGMAKASGSTKELATVGALASTQIKLTEDQMKRAGTTMLIAGGAIAAGVALAISKFAEFDAKMSQVASLSHATADEMASLKDAALKAGQAIGYSASDVADAEIELVKAGISVKDILGGALPGALDLAAAGQLSVADATSIAASAMTQFKLKGTDVTHVADILAAGADKALGSVSDLGEGLKYVGPVADSLGVSIDQTVGTLSLFAQNGILADQAGTGLRGVLQALVSPSAQAQKTLEHYKITMFDSKGAFIGLAGLAGQLHDKLGGLTQAQQSAALGTIFGNQQVTTATVLMQGGAKAVDKWTSAVNDQGFAAEQAAGKMDNLKGDLTKLGAAFDTILIQEGGKSNGLLRDMTKTSTALLHAFEDLPGPVKDIATSLGLVGGAALVAGGAFLLAVPKLGQFQNTLATMATSEIPNVARAAGTLQSVLGGTASFLTGPWGLALGIGATAVAGAFIANTIAAQQRVDDFTASLDKNTGAITKNTRAIAVKDLKDNGGIEAANKLGFSLDTATDAALGDPKAQASVQAAVAAATKSFQKGATAGSPGSGEALAAANKLAAAVGLSSDSLKKSQRDAMNTAKAMGTLKDAETSLTGTVSKATAAIAKNGKTLDSHTAAGQDNQTALDGVADAEKAVIDATELSTSSQVKTTAAWQAGRKALYGVAAQMGLTGAAADDYVNNHLGRIPPKVSTLINVDDGPALARIANINAAYGRLQAEFDSGVSIIVRAGGPAIARAGGGIIPGAPSSKDNTLIHAASGEFVVNAAATAANRSLLESINSGARWNAAAPKWVDMERGRGAAPAVTVNPVVSLEGATFQATIDGQPIKIMIGKQIAAAADAGKSKLQNGKQRLGF